MTKDHLPDYDIGLGHNGGPPIDEDSAYWFALIGEKEMAEFMDVKERTLQKWRRTGDGPPFVRLSGKCVKYRRIEGRKLSESRLRMSTSDPGPMATR